MSKLFLLLCSALSLGVVAGVFGESAGLSPIAPAPVAAQSSTSQCWQIPPGTHHCYVQQASVGMPSGRPKSPCGLWALEFTLVVDGSCPGCNSEALPNTLNVTTITNLGPQTVATLQKYSTSIEEHVAYTGTSQCSTLNFDPNAVYTVSLGDVQCGVMSFCATAVSCCG